MGPDDHPTAPTQPLPHTNHPDIEALIGTGRAERANAEALEARARAHRAGLNTIVTRLREHGLSTRTVAHLLGYASDNSVRQKTSRSHDPADPTPCPSTNTEGA